MKLARLAWVRVRGLIHGRFLDAAVFVVSVVVAGLMILIRPLLWIRVARFGGFLSARIGHLAANPDVYLRSREAGVERGDTVDFFYVSPQGVANEQLLKMWRRSGLIRLMSTRFGESLTQVLGTVPGGGHHIFSTHPTGSSALLPGRKKYLFFNSEEIKRGEDFLRKMGIPVNAAIVCAHQRDSVYLKHHGQKDLNRHDHRDSSIMDYVPMMQELARQGHWVIRMGSEVAERLPDLGGQVIDYAGGWRSDFMDIFLLWKCKFFVGSNSGLSAVNIIWRKPVVLVNYIPFQARDIYAWPAGSIFVPKKLWSLKERRHLTVEEMAKLDVDVHYRGDFYGDRGLEVRNNSPQEILEAAMEMDERLAGRVDEDRTDSERQDKFWREFGDERLYGVYGMRISRRFLEENSS